MNVVNEQIKQKGTRKAYEVVMGRTALPMTAERVKEAVGAELFDTIDGFNHVVVKGFIYREVTRFVVKDDQLFGVFPQHYLSVNLENNVTHAYVPKLEPYSYVHVSDVPHKAAQSVRASVTTGQGWFFSDLPYGDYGGNWYTQYEVDCIPFTDEQLTKLEKWQAVYFDKNSYFRRNAATFTYGFMVTRGTNTGVPFIMSGEYRLDANANTYFSGKQVVARVDGFDDQFKYLWVGEKLDGDALIFESYNDALQAFVKRVIDHQGKRPQLNFETKVLDNVYSWV